MAVFEMRPGCCATWMHRSSWRALCGDQKPEERNSREFYCRKGNLALPLQAAVDSKHLFVFSTAQIQRKHWGCGCLDSIYIIVEESARTNAFGIFKCFGGSLRVPQPLAIPPHSSAYKQLNYGNRQGRTLIYIYSLWIHANQGFNILVSRLGILWYRLLFSLEKVDFIFSICMRLQNILNHEGSLAGFCLDTELDTDYAFSA
jgi:hypothetical protein